MKKIIMIIFYALLVGDVNAQDTTSLMKFISKNSIKTETINLVDFYKTGNKNQEICLSKKFIKILNQITEGGLISKTEIDYLIFLVDRKNRANDTNDSYNFTLEIKGSVIDLCTSEGRLEARKRFAAMAYFLKKQPKAEQGDLLTNGSNNIFGCFKGKRDSRLFYLCCHWNSDDQKWHCFFDEKGDEWGTSFEFWYQNEIEGY